MPSWARAASRSSCAGPTTCTKISSETLLRVPSHSRPSRIWPMTNASTARSSMGYASQRVFRSTRTSGGLESQPVALNFIVIVIVIVIGYGCPRSGHGGPQGGSRSSPSFLVGADPRRAAVERAMRKARQKVLGLPAGFRYHDLRHYFASLLIASGADVKTVQARLRHASAKTTLDTYGHIWPDRDESTRAAVEAVLAARTEQRRNSTAATS